jgi:thiol:disulfide interchange protein DsbD
LWLVIAGFFVAGLLLSFTPCVLPMIPILSSIIVGSQSKQVQNNHKPCKLHAFGLSVAYVLGMALSYTLAGIAAGLSGSLISQSLQSPWILALTALLFVALAFSMFGFYELKLPTVLENKILGVSQKLKGGEFLGVFIMGVISALIVSPCVAAPLAGALIYIGQTHNVLLGGVGLFALAVGMGVPLLLIGASAGSLLPKAGAWMTVVRNLFGVLMLVMAAYLVWPILPNAVTQPVNNVLGLETTSHLPFQRVKSVTELDAAIKNAVMTGTGKTVMLDFYADWCTSCKEMEKFTFSEKSVQAALKDVVLLQADVTENNADDQALLKRFNLFGPPGIIFFDTAGNEIQTRVIGYKNAEDFTKILKQVYNNQVAP